MTKYLLHGGFTRWDNELNKGFFVEFMNDVPDKGTVLLVFFASGDQDTSEAFSDLSNKFKQQAVQKDVTFIQASKEKFIEELENSDAIYFQGGDTNILLETLRSYQDFKKMLEGKTVAGSSAGAYALAKYGAAHDEPSEREGLGILPLRVVCHYESQELPPSQTSLENLENMETDLEIVYLKDCEWKVINF